MPDSALTDHFSSFPGTAVSQKQWNHSVQFCGVSLIPVTEAECVDLIIEALKANQGGWCVTVNLEILRQLAISTSLQALVETSTLRVADGITLIWASRLQGNLLPERVCGSALIYNLTAAAARAGRSIFLLGGNEGTAEKAAAILQQYNPTLRVAGIYCPPFGFERDSTQVQDIVNKLIRAKPDIIYVALGFPKAEKLIAHICSSCPTAWWIGVGISFSYVAGEIGRAPQWAQDLGLESLYRLVQEPRRLAKRYLWVGPPFAAKLLLHSLFRRLRLKG
jgi:N-acetylglucosaminyldiphosphoundecaprenol N-acetyl-beta-D-mannosaminyltransferase